MPEYPTAISTSESPRQRDWLAISAMFVIGLGLVAQAVGAYFNHRASMEYWRATDKMANRLEHQIAITGRAYELAVKHYEPKLDQSNLVEPPQSRPAVNPAESPFEDR